MLLLRGQYAGKFSDDIFAKRVCVYKMQIYEKERDGGQSNK